MFALLIAGAALLVRAGGSAADRNEQAGEQSVSVESGSEDVASPGGAADGAVGQQDEAGAVQAAIAYAGASQEWLYRSDEQIVEAVTAVATPASAGRLSTEVVDEIRVARESLAESPGPVWWVVRPLAWRVESFAGTRATVSVWMVSVLSAVDVAMPQADWTTTTLQLEWTDGVWRVADVADAAGPTPAVGPTDLPWEPEPFADTLERFTRVAEEQPK